MRKNIRLDYFGYQAGVYFVTLCSHYKQKIFSEIINDQVLLKPIGSFLENAICDTEQYYGSLEVHAYVIMPNHLHLIIQIHHDKDELSLSTVIGYLKAKCTRLVIEAVHRGDMQRFNQSLWQKSYYEHVIRNEKDYNEKYQYILMNPYRWKEDEEYLAGVE